MASAEAEAQRRPGQGTVRLSLDAEVVGFSVYPDRIVYFGLGVNGRGLGPGFGYAVTDDILIGTRTAFGFVYVDPDGPVDGDVVGAFSLLPYFEVVFGSDGLVPFIGAQAGFGIVGGDGFDQGSFLLGGYGGVHVMLADNFSFSPYIEANFTFNDPRARLLALLDDRAGFSMSVGFSFMGWIGDVQQAVGDATDDGFDTSGTDDGIFNSGGGGGGGSYDGTSDDTGNTENTEPPPSSDPEGGLE